MAYYSICPDCGGTLDPGEKCDCGEEELCNNVQKLSLAEERNIYVKKIIYQPACSRKSY